MPEKGPLLLVVPQADESVCQLRRRVCCHLIVAPSAFAQTQLKRTPQLAGRRRRAKTKSRLQNMIS